eukprot:368874_1
MSGNDTDLDPEEVTGSRKLFPTVHFKYLPDKLFMFRPENWRFAFGGVPTDLFKRRKNLTPERSQEVKITRRTASCSALVAVFAGISLKVHQHRTESTSWRPGPLRCALAAGLGVGLWVESTRWISQFRQEDGVVDGRPDVWTFAIPSLLSGVTAGLFLCPGRRMIPSTARLCGSLCTLTLVGWMAYDGVNRVGEIFRNEEH